ncbi:MAG: hypothetical protein ACM3XM_18760 [Mycobacterium leprae]
MEKQTRAEAVQNRQVAESFDSLELVGEVEERGAHRPQGSKQTGQQAGWAVIDWGRGPQ